jgi:hypothetical protein
MPLSSFLFDTTYLTDKSRAHQLNTDKLGLGPLYPNFPLAIYLGTLIPAPLRNPTPQKFS